MTDPKDAAQQHKQIIAAGTPNYLAYRRRDGLGRFIDGSTPVEPRFWPKVDRKGNDECWEWQAGCFPGSGYGAFYFEGQNMGAHRMAWMLTSGKIPDGMCVLHECDNPPCCNPAHLWLGTKLDNARDAEEKGRMPHPVGEDVYWAKLSESDVLEIRRLWDTGKVRLKTLGKMFCMSATGINSITTKRNWKHLL